MTYTTEDYFNANEFIPDEKKTKYKHKPIKSVKMKRKSLKELKNDYIISQFVKN